MLIDENIYIYLLIFFTLKAAYFKVKVSTIY
jgi:hypothetical protein